MSIKNEIELNLKKIGYKFNTNMYGIIKKLSYNPPSYKIMADIIFKNLKKYNSKPNNKILWNYTTNFVNGMKYNLIINNKYFKEVLENGLFDPIEKVYNQNIKLFDLQKTINNRYEFIKNFRVHNNNYLGIFDFILLINNFPIILIKVADISDSSNFKKEFLKLEKDFDEIPMFFNFNRFIIITDSYYSKVGTIYDFPEDYITLRTNKKHYFEKDLYDFLKPENILSLIVKNKKIKEIFEDIDISFKNRKNIELTDKEYKFNGDCIESNLNNQIDNTFDFTIDFFTQNLDEILQSEEFTKKLNDAREVPDFKENILYIEEYNDTNNKNELETLIRANKRLVIREASKFQTYQTPSLDIEDIEQFGYIGLLKAIEKFDISMGTEFSTYAVYWIRQSIIRGINDTSLLIRIPTYQWENLFELKKLERESEIIWKEIDYGWISKKLDKPKETIFDLLAIRNTFMNNTSLYTLVGGDEETYLGELVESDSINVEKSIMDLELKEHLMEALSTLDKRSKDIIMKRFGLCGENPMTLEEIGNIYGLTRERIRQIESQALEKLKKPKWAKKYKIYCGG